AANGGEGATIEFAIAALGVKDIIVCGHSFCGAVKGLLNLESIKNLPSVVSWLSHAEATRRIIEENYKDADLSEEDRLNIAIQENVLVQLENLRTHPAVAVKLARGEINLHGWTYKIESGQVFSYDSKVGQFAEILETSNVEAISSSRASLHSVI
ncbi:MAG: hypothetical protein K2Y39_01430, partial [Candidatus Obscuribacterales bacterium]|nr:hypothetical protein [Candidatus Obscuribacterales bacterium]